MFFSGICPIHGTKLETDGCSGLLFCDLCRSPATCLNVLYTNKEGTQVTVLIKEASQIDVALVAKEKKVKEQEVQIQAEEEQLQKCRECGVYWNMFSTYTILTFILACCVLMLSVLLYRDNKTTVVPPAERLQRN